MMIKKYKYSLFFILLFLLTNIVFGANSGSGSGSTLSTVEEIILNSQNAYIIIVIVFILSALTYMAGSLFSVPSWLAKSKDMLYQGIFSLVIMAALPALVIFMDTIFTSLFLSGYNIPPGKNMFDISEGLILWNYIYFFSNLIVITWINLLAQAFIVTPYSVPIAGKIIPFDLSVLHSPLLLVINTIVGFLTFSIMINSFQLLFLNFVRHFLLPFLLPIGLLLRAFSSSMHAGNVLVGISIAAFVIVPITYAIDLQILPQIVDKTDNDKVRAYDSFYLMGVFYNKETLKSVVVENTKCNLIDTSQQLFKDGVPSLDSLGDFASETTIEDCNINIYSGIEDIFNRNPKTGFISQFGIGAGVGYKTIKVIMTSIDNLTKKTFSKDLSPKGSQVLFIIDLTANILFKLITISLLYIFLDFLLSIVVSVVTISALLPFLKFTIIVIFIREFTYNVLGTQISLGQITRLL